jgi:hypothetical protein
MVDGGGARRRDSPIAAVSDDPHSRVALVCQNRRRQIGRAVVDDDDLEVPEGLLENAANAALYVFGPVVSGD